MRRLITLLAGAAFLLMAFAPSAFAFNDGRGFYGETNDKVVTTAGFILIGFFSLFVLIASLIYGRMEKRKDERKAAAKHRVANGDWHGGW